MLYSLVLSIPVSTHTLHDKILFFPKMAASEPPTHYKYPATWFKPEDSSNNNEDSPPFFPTGFPDFGHGGNNGEIGDGGDSSLNIPLLVGLVSGFGTLFIGFLCGVLWFAILGRRRIRLGNSGDPGDFDDEQALLEAEAEALTTMDEVSRQYYNMAKAFIEANPPNSASTDISLSQYLTIQEKGVSAWEFEVDFPNATCFIEGRTEIEFFDSTCCSQTNLPVPRQNEVYYWEAKMFDKPESTLVSVGLSTKPYPTFRLPGFHRYSVAYDSEGRKRINQPFNVPSVGPKLQQGDVIGVGYRPRTGTVFFTRNGKKLEDALHGMRLNLFPTVGATGPCKVHVNFGQAGFVFIEANVKKWGLAPAHGSLAPPPPYGAEQDFLLLETGTTSNTGAGGSSSSGNELHNQHNNTHDSNDNESNSGTVRSPPPFQRTLTSEEAIILPTGSAPDQVNINMSSLSSSHHYQQVPQQQNSISSSSTAATTSMTATASELGSVKASAPITVEPPAKYTRHATSSQALLVHTPPPSYTSDTESISSLEVDDNDDHDEDDGSNASVVSDDEHQQSDEEIV